MPKVAPSQLKGLGFHYAKKHDILVAIEIETYINEMLSSNQHHPGLDENARRSAGLAAGISKLRLLALQAAVGSVPIPELRPTPDVSNPTKEDVEVPTSVTGEDTQSG